MFGVLFGAIVLELLASMGTFGALVAQNLFTNSASGWYVRLDWTAVYSYAVSIISIIITFSLTLGGLARGASGSRGCGLLFNPFAIFLLGFIFTVLFVVIAGFAYRNPLPMHYPCDIFRHLRNSLEMLGMASGKSLIEEGGLLVGICQSSKAFLVLSGISLGMWIVITITSCAAMATGVGSKKNVESKESEQSSIRSALSRLRRHGMSTLPMHATYPDPKASVRPIAQTPPGLVYPQVPRDQPVRPAEPRVERRNVAYARPLQPPAQAKTLGNSQCPPNCTFHGTYQPQYAKNVATHGSPRQSSALPAGPVTVPRASNINSAYASDAYSQDTSPRPSPPHHAQYTSHSPPKPANPIDDSRELGHDANDYEHKNSEYIAQYSPDGHEYAEYTHHIPPHPHSPESNPSRRHRLRQIFSRDSDHP
ncbi:hypothetical protein IW139_000461 [Coemansia sp. RSA 353]|nr:hypothetical protein GGH17_000447 [Coemansia sp. RSA 788]KAJ2146330.1 hypothetical protein IW142_002155 [Coemansia sp. RSA 564]KAJ2176253.1 hypothetical protein GGH16_000184 [Coemansia sp. RSA 560]KAJ2191142.1 hypothetical protein EV181_000519 [Coemansia sp. RSA 532]KAJ2199565.1 hypothetical protein GGH18_000421 [Coemansia sp. RSA 530]KAJ2200901.1 hypothetical protein IW144_000757 [Coemansia sp. RSA 522]KAJ2208877.1 hypothetical protein IW145_000400 [Coemansia sp. RSA 521]KAJ2220678.1 hyp